MWAWLGAAYLTKLSSSLLLALIGGWLLSTFSPPERKKAAVEKVVARVAIASCCLVSRALFNCPHPSLASICVLQL